MPKKLPKLRADLVITRQKQRDEVVFVVKDPESQQYYRYSEIEFQVMSLFDGHHTIEQVQQDYAGIAPEAELDNETIKDFLSSLKQDGLIQRSAKEKNIILLEKQRTYRKQRLIRAKGSLLYLRFPLFDPNKLLDKTIDFIRFFWTRWFFVVSLLMILASYAIIAANWEQIFQSLKEMYSFSQQSAGNIIRLWVVVIIVIAFHEFGHAYTCKNYGGEVHEMGFLLLLFNPCLYANVNDAWIFPEKAKKLWVTFSGAYFEAFIGAIATFAWWITNPGSTFNTYSYTALTICGVSSLAFNFNPLFKLDGYYALMDYLEIPNLRQRSGDYVNYLVKHHIFRKDVETEEDEPKTQRTLFVYGALSKFYITVILITVFFMVKDMLISSFHEIGVIAIAGIMGYLFRKKLLGLGKSLWKFFVVPDGREKAKKRRNRISAVIIVMFVMGFFIPKDVYISVKCHLEPAEHLVIRSVMDGFITNINVDEGSKVKKGQTLFILENPYQEAELERLALDGEISNIEYQRQQSKSDVSGIKESLILKNKANKTLAVKRQRISGLVVSAPVSGTILTPRLAELHNAYVKKGTELCEMGNIEKMHVVIPVRENEAGLVDIGDPVEVRVVTFPMRSIKGHVIEISTQTNETKLENAVSVRIEIENNDDLLRVGMQCNARIKAHRETWNAFLLRQVLRTIRMDLWF